MNSSNQSSYQSNIRNAIYSSVSDSLPISGMTSTESSLPPIPRYHRELSQKDPRDSYLSYPEDSNYSSRNFSQSQDYLWPSHHNDSSNNTNNCDNYPTHPFVSHEPYTSPYYSHPYEYTEYSEPDPYTISYEHSSCPPYRSPSPNYINRDFRHTNNYVRNNESNSDIGFSSFRKQPYAASSATPISGYSGINNSLINSPLMHSTTAHYDSDVLSSDSPNIPIDFHISSEDTSENLYSSDTPNSFIPINSYTNNYDNVASNRNPHMELPPTSPYVSPDLPISETYESSNSYPNSSQSNTPAYRDIRRNENRSFSPLLAQATTRSSMNKNKLSSTNSKVSESPILNLATTNVFTEDITSIHNTSPLRSETSSLHNSIDLTSKDPEINNKTSFSSHENASISISSPHRVSTYSSFPTQDSIELSTDTSPMSSRIPHSLYSPRQNISMSPRLSATSSYRPLPLGTRIPSRPHSAAFNPFLKNNSSSHHSPFSLDHSYRSTTPPQYRPYQRGVTTSVNTPIGLSSSIPIDPQFSFDYTTHDALTNAIPPSNYYTSLDDENTNYVHSRSYDFVNDPIRLDYDVYTSPSRTMTPDLSYRSENIDSSYNPMQYSYHGPSAYHEYISDYHDSLKQGSSMLANTTLASSPASVSENTYSPAHVSYTTDPYTSDGLMNLQNQISPQGPMYSKFSTGMNTSPTSSSYNSISMETNINSYSDMNNTYMNNNNMMNNLVSSNYNTYTTAQQPTSKKSDSFIRMREEIVAICSTKFFTPYLEKRTMLMALILPYNHHYYIYIEISKLDMDNCHFKDACSILIEGLQYNYQNEMILHKLLKAEEKLHNYSNIVDYINMLSELGGKSWRGIVEGVYILAKQGNLLQGKNLLEDIHIYQKKSQGAVILERAKYYYISGDIYGSITMLTKCILAKYKCTPLYFYFYHIYEYICIREWMLLDEFINNGTEGRKTEFIYQHMIGHISNEMIKQVYSIGKSIMNRELKWKFYYIQGQYLFRYLLTLRTFIYEHPEYMSIYAKLVQPITDIIRIRFALSLSVCPYHLKWKIWLILCRAEILLGHKNLGLLCFYNCFEFSSPRNYSIVLMEREKMMAFIHDNAPLPSLPKALPAFTDEWKILIEQCHIYVRQNRSLEGYAILTDALHKYPGAGRLWATYIQFTHQLYGPCRALYVFYASLQHVSRSGEVWVEAARLFLSPISPFFDLQIAEKCLSYAAHFTPQYGDIYIEVYRLHLLKSKVFLLYHDIAPIHLVHILLSTPIDYYMNIALFNEPNYGPLWFTAKNIPLESSRETLENSRILTATNVSIYSAVYYQAIVESLKRREKTTTCTSVPYGFPNVSNLKELMKNRYCVGESLQYESFCAAFNVETAYLFPAQYPGFEDVIDMKNFFKRLRCIKTIYGNCRIDV